MLNKIFFLSFLSSIINNKRERNEYVNLNIHYLRKKSRWRWMKNVVEKKIKKYIINKHTAMPHILLETAAAFLMYISSYVLISLNEILNSVAFHSLSLSLSFLLFQMHLVVFFYISYALRSNFSFSGNFYYIFYFYFSYAVSYVLLINTTQIMLPFALVFIFYVFIRLLWAFKFS